MNTNITLVSVLKKSAIAAGVSAAVNSVLYFIYTAMDIITGDIYIQPNVTMTIVPILISSIVPSILAALVLLGLSKFTKNPYRVFTILSVVLTVLSFYNPYTIPNVTNAYAIALNTMHIVVAGASVYFQKPERA